MTLTARSYILTPLLDNLKATTCTKWFAFANTFVLVYLYTDILSKCNYTCIALARTFCLLHAISSRVSASDAKAWSAWSWIGRCFKVPPGSVFSTTELGWQPRLQCATQCFSHWWWVSDLNFHSEQCRILAAAKGQASSFLTPYWKNDLGFTTRWLVKHVAQDGDGRPLWLPYWEDEIRRDKASC